MLHMKLGLKKKKGKSPNLKFREDNTIDFKRLKLCLVH